MHETTGNDLSVRLSWFTQGKDLAHPENNEDVIMLDERGVILADGSTTKNKKLAKQFETAFEGRSGGREAAELVAAAALASGLDGRELVDRVSQRLLEFYRTEFPQGLDEKGELDKNAAMATTLLSVRFDGLAKEIVITQVGDTAFRVTLKDGQQFIHSEKREIDELNAANRAKAIQEALDHGYSENEALAMGREAIMESLNKQGADYWNNPYSPYGFGYITGGFVPDKFIKVYRFNTNDVQTIELISDGYTYAS